MTSSGGLHPMGETVTGLAQSKFKYRTQVGLDIAIEALRDCLRKRLASTDDLWLCAKIDRVQNVMKPYMEAML